MTTTTMGRPMRSLVLKEIADYHSTEKGFDRRTMRWDDFFFINGEGIVRFTSQRAANKSNTGAIHLGEATTEDFETLTDDQLLQTLVKLIRQRSKQL